MKAAVRDMSIVLEAQRSELHQAKMLAASLQVSGNRVII